MHGRHVGATDQALDLVDRAVGPGLEEGRVGHQEGDGAEADDEGQDVEVADEAGGVEHRTARLLGVGHGEEAHQDVRQPGGAEHQARPSEIAEIGSVTRPPGAMIAWPFGCTLTASNIAPGLKPKCQHRGRHEGGAAQQQAGLDDLHPGGGEHAAEGDVEDHQHADDDDRDHIGQAEQQLDQLAGADHLGDQVEGDDGQRAAGRERADRGLLQPVGGDVGEGVLAEIAQALGDHEQDDRPADQKADRIDQAVIAEA